MVEWDGLENRCTGNRTEGSNPSLSAPRESAGSPAIAQVPRVQDVPPKRSKKGHFKMMQPRHFIPLPKNADLSAAWPIETPKA